MTSDHDVYDEESDDDRKRVWTTKELLMDSAVRAGAIRCAACPDGIATVQLVGDLWKKQTVFRLMGVRDVLAQDARAVGRRHLHAQVTPNPPHPHARGMEKKMQCKNCHDAITPLSSWKFRASSDWIYPLCVACYDSLCAQRAVANAVQLAPPAPTCGNQSTPEHFESGTYTCDREPGHVGRCQERRYHRTLSWFGMNPPEPSTCRDCSSVATHRQEYSSRITLCAYCAQRQHESTRREMPGNPLASREARARNEAALAAEKPRSTASSKAAALPHPWECGGEDEP